MASHLLILVQGHHLAVKVAFVQVIVRGNEVIVVVTDVAASGPGLGDRP